MFERFSDQARRVVVLAQQEARKLNHNHIGTEHILLGILRENECTAAGALRGLDIDLDALSAAIKTRTGTGAEAKPSAGHIPFTPQAKKVLEFSLRESLHLGSTYIGSEHILLGLIREGEGIGAQVLTAQGITLERMREEVARLLETTGGERHFGSPVEVRFTGENLHSMALQLRAMHRRLAVVEAKLGIEESPAAARVRTLDTTLAQVRKQKEAAIDQQDFERAAALRDEEKRLIVSRAQAMADWLTEEAGKEDTPGGEAATPL